MGQGLMARLHCRLAASYVCMVTLTIAIHLAVVLGVPGAQIFVLCLDCGPWNNRLRERGARPV